MNPRVGLFGALAVLVALPAAAGVPEFFAPAQPSGRIVVRLHPMENVTPGTNRLVTFGVPFPRGSVTVAGLATLRVLSGGTEVPAFVEQLTPWRHATNPAIDGQSVRVARVQIHHTFAVGYPAHEDVMVEWGFTNRLANVPTLENPRNGWHLVTTGSFVGADGVNEPDVYAVLPRTHLAKGAVRPLRMQPIERSVTEPRSNPATMDAIETWPDFLEQEHAQKNNFYSVINEDDPLVTPANRCPYKTDSEPWLYDRASTMYLLYMRTGFLKALREAVRHAEFYRLKLYPAGTNPPAAVGCFSLKNPDPGGYIGSNGTMYAYAEPLAYQHWLTGDPVALTAIPWIVNCHEESGDEPMRWSNGASAWTERHSALRLLASIVAYEVTGNTTYRDNMLTFRSDLLWHQNGGGGAIPPGGVDGGLWHWLQQHEGQPDPTMIASPWMSALMVDAMVRTYSMTEDVNVGHFVRRMGTFLKAATKFVDPTLYDYNGQLREVDYITYINGGTWPDEGTTPEHALELAASLGWASYFGNLLGAPDPTVRQAAMDTYFTYDVGVNYWIRPAGPQSGLTAFRVSPWRKWGWEHRPAGSLSFTIGDVIFEDGYEY